MERTITYQISESEHGLRVEQYLRHKGYSYQNLTQLKKMPESILINGIWSYMRSTLSCGDTLTVHIQESEYSEHIPPVQLPLDIIYEDDDLLVVNKPAGMPIHPSLNNYKNSLANALMYYYKEQGKPFIFRCTNRLDRDTSGLTVIAKHLVVPVSYPSWQSVMKSTESTWRSSGGQFLLLLERSMHLLPVLAAL